MPEIRAALLQLYLQQMRAAGPDSFAALAGLAGAEVVSAIELADGADWLPLSHEVSLAEAWHGRFGLPGVRELGRAVGAASFGSPVFRPMIEATFSMLGPRPDVLVRIGASGWEAASRHAGRCRVARSDARGARLVFDEAPPEMSSVALAERMVGTMECLFERSGRPVRAEVTWPQAGGSPELVLDWT